ncbi:MAG: phenylalanine--tRNA ligase subunit alpha [Candidatus Microgenomates bacterium]
MKTKVTELKNSLKITLSKIKSVDELDSVYLTYLGKKGIVNNIMKDLQGYSIEDKKKYGPLLNDLKKSIESSIESKRIELAASNKSTIDLTVPGLINNTGHLHPTTTIIREMNEFFRYLGFSIGEGPELEDVEYNFRRLNLPEGHPATDLQDSLFIKEPQYLMRTHTSSVETRILSEYHDKLPLRVVVPGKCYRNETNSATNTSFFYQYQGFVVDRGITIQHLKDTLTKFHQFLFGDDVKLRFRYKYYPEVSPGMGVDMQCRFCQGSGCSVCKHRGFIEVLGSGMIHYNTMKACGIDPEIYTGYAFGMGLDRLVMSKYGIKDIRKLYGGEIVYV